MITPSLSYTPSQRVLSRARWSSWQRSRLLLDLLVTTFLPEGTPLIFLVDETLERRAGKKVVVSLGIRWCVVCRSHLPQILPISICLPLVTTPFLR